jgi:glycosyltransferase involved in cell wall biosynthesis
MDVSVIICCYNSSARIKTTLKHLALQVLEGLKCEVILIDNCCTDNTVEVAINSWEEFGNPFPLVIQNENDPGLSNARKTGLSHSRSEIILFCDDDNWLNSNYVGLAYFLINSDKDIGMVGGKGIPAAEVKIPNWVKEVPSRFACGEQANYSGILTDRNWLYGAGLCLKKSILLEIYSSGFRSFLIDRVGEELSSGGDVELCQWFVLVNKKLYYSDELVFKHYLPTERLTEDYFLKLQLGIKKAGYIHFKYECAIKFFQTSNIIQKSRWLYHLRKDLMFLVNLFVCRNKYFVKFLY